MGRKKLTIEKGNYSVRMDQPLIDAAKKNDKYLYDNVKKFIARKAKKKVA